MLNRISKPIVLFFLIVLWFLDTYSQGISTSQRFSGSNTITCAVPFLMIAPDSRAGALGDAGAATTPDAMSGHYNCAKFAFVEKDLGLSISYTPWLRALTNDINLSYLSGYKRIDKRQVVGVSILYFSLGNIEFTDISGTPLKNYNPNEFAIDVSYALKLSPNLSGGIAMRYIYSNLTGGQYVQGVESHAGKSFAGDLSAYYQNKFTVGQKVANYSWGMNISNVGKRISYTDDTQQNFIPMNLRVGGTIGTNIDDYNSLTLVFDMNKLLVPTPPIWNPNYPGNADSIISGKRPPNGVPSAIIQSFYDAPDGLKEELHEITYSTGLEYWYAKQFAIRTGFFYEHPTKGNRQYVTAGLGLRLNVFSLDFAYLIPTSRHNPLENTLRFSLAFNFEALKKTKEKDKTIDSPK